MSDMQARLASIWAEFSHLAEQADQETKRLGQPYPETTLALEALSATLDKLEAALTQRIAPGALTQKDARGEVVLNGTTYTYERGTPEHARFVRVLRGGMAGLSEAQMTRVKLADLTDEQKAMTQADDTTGGYAASAEFANDLLRLMVDASPVRQVATVIPTGGNGALVPVRAGIQTAKRISEVGSRVQTTADLAFRLDSVPVHEMYADTAISRALLADSGYPLDAELAGAASRAFALLEGKEFVAGTGVGEMLGLDNTTFAPARTVTCADSSGHLIAADDLQKLLYESLSAVYLPGATLAMHPKTLGKLRQLKATSGNTYLFPQSDPPGSLAGFPVVLLPDLADNGTPAAGNKVIYLIHPLAYAIVVRQDVTVMRLTEQYAELGKLAFYVFQRTGGQVVVPEAAARLVTA